MDTRIFDLPDSPLPLDVDSYYEVLVPDVSSATGYTSCKIKPSNLLGRPEYVAIIDHVSGNPTTFEIKTDVGVIAFVKDSAGYYKADLTTILGIFGINYKQVYYTISDNILSGLKLIKINLRNDNILEIKTYDNNVLTDALLTGTRIKLEFYI